MNNYQWYRLDDQWRFPAVQKPAIQHHMAGKPGISEQFSADEITQGLRRVTARGSAGRAEACAEPKVVTGK